MKWLILAALLVAIVGNAEAQSYNATIIGTSTADMYDVVIGDYDGIPGDTEAYATTHTGDLLMVKKTGGTWAQAVVYDGPGILQNVAGGDFDAAHPGPELVVGNSAGALTKLTATAGVWSVTPMGTAGTKIWDLVVGEVHSGNLGEEVLATGLQGTSGTRTWLVTGSGDSWTITQIFAQGLYVSIGDADPTQPGNEIAVLAKTAVNLLRGDGLSWTAQQLPGSGAYWNVKNIIIGDADPSVPGNEIYYDREITNSQAWVYQVSPDGVGGWASQVIYYTDGDEPADAPTVHHVHGMALGDWNAARLGLELALTHSHVNHAPGRAVLIYGEGATWSHQVIFSGLDEFHNVAGGDLDPDSPGQELVLVGHASEIVMTTQVD